MKRLWLLVFLLVGLGAQAQTFGPPPPADNPPLAGNEVIQFKSGGRSTGLTSDIANYTVNGFPFNLNGTQTTLGAALGTIVPSSGGTFSGGINAPSIGATTPGTGAFTTLSTTGTAVFGNAGTIPQLSAQSGHALLNTSGTAGDVWLQVPSLKNVILRSANGNIAQFADVGGGSALANSFLFRAEATGTDPIIDMTNSTDTNVGLELKPKGTGVIHADGSYFKANAFGASTGIVWSGSQAYGVGQSLIALSGNQSGSTSGQFSVFSFSVPSDTAVVPNGSKIFQVIENVGAGATGSRVASFGNINITGALTSGGSFSGGQFSFQSSFNAGGTSGTLAGNGFGSNPTCGLNSGATFWATCVGEEIDVQAATGSSVGQLTGLAVVLTSAHTVHGSLNLDSAIAVGSQGGITTGWDYGIRFGLLSGPPTPFVTTATLIDVNQPMTLANGIHLANATFTGNSWDDGHIKFTGAGEIIASALPTSAPATHCAVWANAGVLTLTTCP